MTLRRPDSRAVEHYLAALAKYHGVPPLNIWRRYSLRTRVAAIWLYRNGKPAPLDEIAETPAARRRPTTEDM